MGDGEVFLVGLGPFLSFESLLVSGGGVQDQKLGPGVPLEEFPDEDTKMLAFCVPGQILKH